MRYAAASVPQMPPPDIVPFYCRTHPAITQGLLQQYLNRYIYIWMYGNGSFWFYPIQVDDKYLYGFTWAEDGWKYDELPWRMIDSFY